MFQRVPAGVTIGLCSISLLLFAGCGASLGSYFTCAETQTQLNRSNYKVVQTGISGYAECWYLFGTIPMGEMELYRIAMKELKSKAETEGKPAAIINVTQDLSVTSYIVVSRRSVTLTADVIEFAEQGRNSQ